MTTVLTVLLILVCVQGLVKFALGFLVSYPARINRIASYYRRGGRAIAIYDDVTLLVMVALVVMLLISGMQYLSFVTGLVVGMLTIQIFFHRFREPLPPDRAPEESPAPPIQLMSYAIQDRPALAWREIAFMTVMFAWALWMLIADGLLG